MMKPWRADPPGFSDVKRVWRDNRCVGSGTVAVYRYWICRFLDYCSAQGLEAHKELTLAGAVRFATWWRLAGSPRSGRVVVAFQAARSALRSWSFALSALGKDIPQWRPSTPAPPISPAMAAFAAYLTEVRGNPPCTIHKKLAHMGLFSGFCRRRHRPLHRARLQDIDAFVVWCRMRYARTTVSDICSTLRGYQRFLCASGRSAHNLAGSIMAPLVRLAERPHRSLPWSDVQRILEAIDRSTPTGRRDYAILLMMSVYGLGAGEVIALTLEDINWVRRETDARQRVQVPHDEGVANRIDPELCRHAREGVFEALTGAHAGRAIERRKTSLPECRCYPVARRQYV